ncbi:hypothetical protein AZF04_09660 [Alkalihalobacillus trypoxylicola]|uniref:Uncharacterized protein n=1 Tax=Alkalihalobacillus trypoxylicola TaxID=519424 RepID=A0A161QGR8_9BACI|nr:hypothetical protein AZF04_09660 [Alkalihalobacillus trypoxylicola]
MSESIFEQIKRMKAKDNKQEQRAQETKVGRCGCGCGRFKHQMRDRSLMRICKDCNSERVF